MTTQDTISQSCTPDIVVRACLELRDHEDPARYFFQGDLVTVRAVGGNSQWQVAGPPEPKMLCGAASAMDG